MVKTKELKKRSKKLAAAAMSLCLMAGMAPAAAFADDGGAAAGLKTWKEIYQPLGVDTTSGYDAVTSATQFASGHAAENSAAAGIPAVVNRVKDGEGKTLSLDGANIPDSQERKDVYLYKASHKTFESAAANKKYGTDEFLIEPWDGVNTPGTDPEKWSWNKYFDSVYAVTVSDGTKTVGAVPWIDYYGQKGKDTGTSGKGHYNYVEVALNNGAIPTQPSMSVDRYSAFYDGNNDLKSGKYTVTVYSTVYKPLVANDIWVAARSGAEVSLGDATATSVSMTFTKALPEDFDPVYTVDGKAASFNSTEGELTFETVKPGKHNVVISSNNITDGNKKYLDVNSSFVYSVASVPVEYDGVNRKIVSKGGELTLDDYVGNIAKVNVNGKDYIPAGKGKNVARIVNNDGSIDLSKTEAAGTEDEIKITVTSTGYPDLTFVYQQAKAKPPAAQKPAETKKPAGDDPAPKAAVKKANTMKVKVNGKSIKAKKLKKKGKTFSLIKVRKAVGKVKYTKLSGDKKMSVNAKTGKIKIGKAPGKGMHKMKVLITAAGNSKYEPARATVTVKIKVR